MTTSSLSTTLTATLPSATDTVLGGVQVQSNSGILVDSNGNISVDSTQFAPVNNPNFTGTVIVPTVTAGNNSDNAASTGFVDSAISTALGSFVPNDGITVIDLTPPADYPMTTSDGTNTGSYTKYSIDVVLNNTSSMFIVKNNTYAFWVYSPEYEGGMYTAYATYPTIGTITLPSDVEDGHTFKITSTGGNIDLYNINLTEGGPLLTTAYDGYICNASLYDIEYPSPTTTTESGEITLSYNSAGPFVIPGTYTYSSSLSSWVQVS